MPDKTNQKKKAPSYYPVKTSGIVDVGLDTITWRVSNGNLKIIQEMEDFFNGLQKKYIGNSAYPLK